VLPNKGRGLFAEKDFVKDEVIFTETPLCAMQHVENRAAAWTCANCFAFLGSLEAQLTNLQMYCGIPTNPNLRLPHSAAAKPNTSFVDCVGGCGEKYCNEHCRQQAYSEHHQLLCVGPINDTHHPLVLFKQYAIANNELFLLAAQLICRIIMHRKNSGTKEGTDVTALFHHKVWWEVVNLDCGFAVDDLKKMLNDTLTLLQQAILHPILAQIPNAPIDDLFTFEYYARLMGMLEINDNSIDIDSPLHVYHAKLDNIKEHERRAALKVLNPVIDKLTEMKQEEEGEEEDAEMGTEEQEMTDSVDTHDHREHGDEMEAEEEEEEEEPIIPRFTGLGVFPTEAMLNHSCEPNCTIKFPTNFLAHIVATKDIKKGEEILHCYIEDKQPYEDRQYDLYEYGFKCECPKCQRELAAMS
jgi:hypothetical protein